MTQEVSAVSVRKHITIEQMKVYSGGTNIHTSEDAGKDWGLGGALVQGGQLVGYLIEFMIRSEGEKFLSGGEISASFVKPVRPGNVVEVKASPAETSTPNGVPELQIWLENQDGEKVTVGTARIDAQ